MKMTEPSTFSIKGFFLLSIVLLTVVGTASMSYAITIIDFKVTPNISSGGSISGTFSLEFDASGLPVALTSASITSSNSISTLLFSAPPVNNFSDNFFSLTNGGSRYFIRSLTFANGFPEPIPFLKSGGFLTTGRLDPGPVLSNAGNTTYAPVPEPGSVVLLSTGLLGLAGYRWQQRRRSERQIGWLSN